MAFIHKLWNKIKQPHAVLLCIFYVLFAMTIAGILSILFLIPNQGIFHYILYTLSAIEFAYFVYTIIYLAPKIKGKIIVLLHKNKFSRNLLVNYGYRTIIFSICSFIFNISFVLFQGVMAILTNSVWYITITIYYLSLSVVKAVVFLSKKKGGNSFERQNKVYRFCGAMFIFLTAALSGIIILIYKSNMRFEYAGLMIYVVAIYTFVKLSFAIYNLFKARHQNDKFIQSLRNVNLCSALVSIFVLQVAMFQAFSPESNSSFANALTGAGVAIIMLALGVFMIVKAGSALRDKKFFERENSSLLSNIHSYNQPQFPTEQQETSSTNTTNKVNEATDKK